MEYVVRITFFFLIGYSRSHDPSLKFAMIIFEMVQRTIYLYSLQLT